MQKKKTCARIVLNSLNLLLKKKIALARKKKNVLSKLLLTNVRY